MRMTGCLLVGVLGATLVACVSEDGVEVGDEEFAVGGTPLYPDIVNERPNHMQIQNTQQGEFLRYTSAIANLGAGKLKILGGGQVVPCTVDGETTICTQSTQQILDASGNVVATHDAGVFLFHAAHNHWHQSAVDLFQIRAGSLDGPVIGTSTKVTFCMIDYEWLDGTDKKTREFMACNSDFQGVTPGWADQYHHSTEGNEIDMTGQPQGNYYLTLYVDPDQHWLESNENNQLAWTKFFLDRSTGSNPNIVELEHSTCDPILGPDCFANNPSNR